MNSKEKFEMYVVDINKKDKIAIYCGPDTDGVCSSVLMSKVIERNKGRGIDLLIAEKTNKPGLSKKNKFVLEENSINKLIVLDIAIDNADEETLHELTKYKTLIIDHHHIVKDLNSDEVIFIKPSYFSSIPNAQYPTSKMIFDLSSGFTDINDLDWICSVGVVSDSSYKTWTDFVDKVIKKYNLKSEKDIWSSDPGLLSSYLSSAMIVDQNNFLECFNILSQSNKPQDLLSSNIKRFKKTIDDCIKELKENFKEKAERYENLELVFYYIKPKYRVGSPLSTIISFENMPNKTLIVLQENDDGMMTVDARRQDGKINLAELMKKSVEDFDNASGGGHIPAAGATFKKEDLIKFKENIKRILSKDN